MPITQVVSVEHLLSFRLILVPLKFREELCSVSAFHHFSMSWLFLLNICSASALHHEKGMSCIMFFPASFLALSWPFFPLRFRRCVGGKCLAREASRCCWRRPARAAWLAGARAGRQGLWAPGSVWGGGGVWGGGASGVGWFSVWWGGWLEDQLVMGVGGVNNAWARPLAKGVRLKRALARFQEMWSEDLQAAITGALERGTLGPKLPMSRREHVLCPKV